MSQISLKSISGITSITTPAGVDNQFTLHNYDTSEAVKLDIAGNLHFHNHLNITGVTTFADDVTIKSSNPLKLSNAGNSASCQVLCDGGARLHLKSYNQTMATFENGQATIFYTDSGQNRLQISNNGNVSIAKDLDVDVFEGYSFVSFEKDSDNKLVVEIKNGDNITKLGAKILVGADGANSRVRKQLNVNTNSDWHKAIAIRAYIDSPNYLEIFKERTLMFEINVSAEKGYAWAFPSKGNLLNIGIGVPLNIFKKEKLDINVLLQDFITQLTNRGVVVENIRDEKSYLLPFASSRPKFKNDINVALIGDASSMINPMSGEGIFYGMEAGYLLAKNTYNLIDSPDLTKGIADYEKAFSKRFRKHYLSCALARLLLQNPYRRLHRLQQHLW